MENHVESDNESYTDVDEEEIPQGDFTLQEIIEAAKDLPDDDLEYLQLSVETAKKTSGDDD